MHSTKELSGASFGITAGGKAAALEDVLPWFTDQDRLGVVVREPYAGAGASLLVLAAVSAFYDVQRRRGEDFFIYPDYFVFHAGAWMGDHRKLEIWPSHKEVVVEPDAEALLRAINDRGVTRLAVPDGAPAEPRLERESTASARSRIATCLAYDPSGRTSGADVAIAGNEVTERYVAAMLEASEQLPAEARAAAAASRPALRDGGRPLETYRALALDEALGLLSPGAPRPGSETARADVRAPRTRAPAGP